MAKVANFRQGVQRGLRHRTLHFHEIRFFLEIFAQFAAKIIEQMLRRFNHAPVGLLTEMLGEFDAAFLKVFLRQNRRNQAQFQCVLRGNFSAAQQQFRCFALP